MKPTLWQIVLSIGLLLTMNLAAMWMLPSGQQHTVAQWQKSSDDAGGVRGFAHRTFVNPDGSRLPYVVYVPHDWQPHDHLPLIIYLNGVGENGIDGVSPLKNGLAPAIWEACGEFRAVVVWPQCPAGKSWTDDPEVGGMAINIATHIQQEYSTDPDRWILTGLSGGGSGVWSLAARHPERFAAIVPVSAGPVSDADLQSVIDANIPVWSLFVSNDKPIFSEGNRAARNKMLQQGRSPLFTELQTPGNGVSHNAWSFAYRSPAVRRWLWHQDRRRQPQPDEKWKHHGSGPHASTATATESTPSIASSLNTVHSVTTASEDTLTEVPLGLKLTEGGELHMEFQADDGVRACGIAMSYSREAKTAPGFIFAVRTATGLSEYSRLPPGWQSADLQPLADHVYLRDQWNDLRVRCRSDHLTVRLNGSQIIKASPADGPWPPAVSLVAHGSTGATVRWRSMRTRGTADSRRVQSPQHVPIDSWKTADDQPGGPDTLVPPDIATIAAAWARQESRLQETRWSWRQATSGTAAVLPVVTDAGISGSAEIRESSVRLETSWRSRTTRITRASGILPDAEQLAFQKNFRFGFSSLRQVACGLEHYTSLRSDSRRVDFVQSARWSDIRGVLVDLGNIQESQSGQLLEQYFAAPLLALAPGTAAAGAIDLARYTLQPQTDWIAGVECCVIEEIPSDELSSRRHWLDPHRDFRVMRSMTWSRNELRQQTDIRYVEDRALGWRPDHWTVIVCPAPTNSSASWRFPGSLRLLQSASATCTDWSRIGAADSNHTVTFPSGTRYFDQRRGTWLRQRADNSVTPLSLATINALMSGINLPTPSASGLQWALTAALGVLLGGWWWFGQRHRSSSPQERLP